MALPLSAASSKLKYIQPSNSDPLGSFASAKDPVSNLPTLTVVPEQGQLSHDVRSSISEQFWGQQAHGPASLDCTGEQLLPGQPTALPLRSRNLTSRPQFLVAAQAVPIAPIVAIPSYNADQGGLVSSKTAA